jgi:hypothetical protein
MTAPGRQQTRTPGALDGAAQLLALWTLAVAQPIYNTLGPQVEFFIAHHCQPADLAIFVLALSAGLPALLILPWLLLRRLAPRHHQGLHWLACGTLAALFGIQVCKLLRIPGLLALGGGVAAGVAVVIALARSPSFGRFLAVLGWSAPACALLFCSATPIQQLALGVLNADPLLPPVKPGPPIVFVMLDEFPLGSLLDAGGRIDAARFPNFAALASDSTWYPYASSACDDTVLSVPSMLASCQPAPERSPLLTDYPRNLFTWLGATYQLKVREGLTRLAPRGSTQTVKDDLPTRLHELAEDTAIYYGHIALPRSLARAWLPSVEFSWNGFAKPKNQKEARSADFRDFIDSLTPSERPTLYFKHALLPHYPYIYLPDGQEYDNSGQAVCDGLDGLVWKGDWQARLALQRELLQVVFLDKLIGELVARLKAGGLYDRCILVVTSDHGAVFRGGVPHRLTTADNLVESMRVPLFIKEPGQKQGKTSLANATTLDIVPTIADILGLELPWRPAGRSLRGLTDAPTGGKTFLGHLHAKQSHLFTLDDWKARFDQSLGQVAREFPQPGVQGLFEIGPHPELFGRPLGELAKGAPSGIRADLPLAGLLDDVDSKAQFLPVRLKGTLSGAGTGAGRLPLAFALNERVAALGYAQPDGSFEALLDPSFLKDGRNTLELYLIGAGQTLHRLDRESRSYRLEAGKVTAGDGATYSLGPGPSLIEQWLLESASVTLKGWVQVPAGARAVRLLAFRRSSYLTGWPLEGEGAVRFEHELPRELAGDELPVLVALFSNGQATVLARRPNYVLSEAVITPSTPHP